MLSKVFGQGTAGFQRWQRHFKYFKYVSVPISSCSAEVVVLGRIRLIYCLWELMTTMGSGCLNQHPVTLYFIDVQSTDFWTSFLEYFVQFGHFIFHICYILKHKNGHKTLAVIIWSRCLHSWPINSLGLGLCIMECAFSPRRTNLLYQTFCSASEKTCFWMCLIGL